MDNQFQRENNKSFSSRPVFEVDKLTLQILKEINDHGEITTSSGIYKIEDSKSAQNLSQEVKKNNNFLDFCTVNSGNYYNYGTELAFYLTHQGETSFLPFKEIKPEENEKEIIPTGQISYSIVLKKQDNKHSALLKKNETDHKTYYLNETNPLTSDILEEIIKNNSIT
jgi:hypothetical protein